MDLGLKNKRALVLGSSGGIGKAVAKQLVDAGCRVCLNSRNEENLRRTKEEIKAEGYLAADLTLAGEGRSLVRKFIQQYGGIDILVTNTGGPSKGKFDAITERQWQLDFQSLWMSVVETVQEALPGMQTQKWGRVMMITSIAAKDPLPGLTTSNGLRAGLNGLCKSLAREVAIHGVTVNTILPGYTDTDRLRELNLTEEFVKSKVPAGRLGRPEELAALVGFLASVHAGYITGQAISIDGGI
jgi:3-oxoacyl-[acyl-carrier protein] reductase